MSSSSNRLASGPPPPLPARSSSPPRPSASVLDSKQFYRPASAKDQWISAPDPRSSSSQSLHSVVSDRDERRTLLLIYIHGFYGNKQSFRSFPHHVHSYLRSALSDSHLIHSKIYPRYKTYRAIEVARDNFSEWLIPHESPSTDIILVGHSMGGILAAEIALMPNRHPYQSHPFKHRILGTISLDSPFLGLHPGIIVAGISSLFSSAPEPPSDGPDSVSQILGRPPNRQQTADPHFDPPFWNDNPFKEAPFIKRIMNFASKHRSEGIVNATANHIVSHLEYGGCLADFHGLRRRYDRIRALEDVDELQALADNANEYAVGGPAPPQGPTARVRFVNYYTLSSGRPPKPKPAADLQATASQSTLAPTPSTQSLSVTNTTNTTLSREQTQESSVDVQRPSVSISIEDHSDSGEPAASRPITSQTNDLDSDSRDPPPSYQRYSTTSVSSDFNRLSMQDLDPIPMEDDDDPVPTPAAPPPPAPLATPPAAPPAAVDQIANQAIIDDIMKGLPPIPDSPTKPTEPDLNQYPDKDAKKQVEREHKRQVKTYEKAVKDRNRAIREREKLIEKRRKKAQAQLDKQKGTDQTQPPNQTLPQDKAAESDDGSSISSIDSDELNLTETQQQHLLSIQQQQHQQQLPPQLDSQQSLGTQTELGSGDLPTPVIEATRAALEQQALEPHPNSGQEAEDKSKNKKKKNKKFCTLPSKVDGVKDPTWVDVYMDGMDEVGAHCGLFFSGPHYDKLVGDVASRVIGWVQDDLTKKAILELHNQ